MIEEKKGKKFKLLLLAIAIVVIIMFIHYLYTNNKKLKTEPNGNVNNTEYYQYKAFKYAVPSGLKFMDYNDKQFKIDGNDWYAIVKLYYDDDKDIYNKTEVLSGFVKFVEKDISNYYNSKVNNVDTIIFEKSEQKSVICYFATDWFFDYEVRIFNADNSYKVDALNEIMDTLLNPVSKDYENYYIFGFDSINFK